MQAIKCVSVLPPLSVPRFLTPSRACLQCSPSGCQVLHADNSLFASCAAARCAQLQWLMPDWVPTKWLTLFTQAWEGDITVCLPASLWNLGKTIANPSAEDLAQAVKTGELSIWEKLSAIQANCQIEATLDACLARITNKVRERPLGGLSRRIPSWLNMSFIGQPAVASWGCADHGPPGSEAANSIPHSDMAAANGMGSAPVGIPSSLVTAVVGSPGRSRMHHHHHLFHHGGGLGMVATIHEGMGDEHPPRVASWGSNDIADSVADFPAAAPSPGMQSCSVSLAGESEQDGDEQSESSSLHSGGSGVTVNPYVLAQLDCCDSSVLTDIWGSLLPLASSAMALEVAVAAADTQEQGLDFIAP